MNYRIKNTERLQLRLLLMSDMEKVHELHKLPETDQFNTLGIPENKMETEKIMKHWVEQHNAVPQRQFVYCLEEKESSDFVGLIALNLGKEKYQSGEVWFKIHPQHWNKGYATEALKQLLEFGFKQQKLHRIEAGCAVDNLGSIKVLEKAGMQREGRKRQLLPLKSGWSDNFEYARLATDK